MNKTNVEAVEAQLEGVGVVPGLQQSARSLAAAMDETSSARDIATIGRELRQTLAAIAEAHAEAEEVVAPEDDPIVQLQKRYAERRAGL